MSAWVDNAQLHEGMRHLIDSAVFELSFGSEMAPWANEPQLERIVETELMAVVDEVFTEVSSTRGPVRIDSLEIDLGLVRFDGTWDGPRERLRDLLHAALQDIAPSTDARKGSGHRVNTEATQASAELDILAHFLLYGLLPTGVRVKDGSSVESLLLTEIRSDPRRLADMIFRTSSSGVVASRLARQFSDSVLEQVAAAFSAGHAEVLVTLARGLHRVATARGSGSVWQNEMRPVLWSHLLTNLAAPSPPRIDLVARKALEESASVLGLTFRELAHQLSHLVAESVEPAALFRRLASDAAPLFPSIDDLVARLEQGKTDAVESALEKLRSGDLPLAVLSGRLSTLGHRRLIAGILEATEQEPEGTSALGKAIESYAQRSGNAKAFYLQVLERLVAGDLIDLEGMSAESPVEQPQGVRRDSAEPPGIEVAAETHAVTRIGAAQEVGKVVGGASSDDAAQALGLYLRTGARTLGVDRQRLMDVAEHLLRSAPDQAIELLRRALSEPDDATSARLVELLPEQLLVRALYLLAPAVHARVQRYADVVASAFRGFETGLSAARISTLKWQYCFRHLLSTAGEVDDEGSADGLIAYLASHAEGFDAGEIRSQMRALLDKSAPRTATEDEQGSQIGVDASSRRASERAIRGYDLYAQLEQYLGGVAAPGSQGSQALLRVIEELARDHPEQLQRILLELREGVLETPQTLRLSGTELRALVRAFLSLPSASGRTERTQLGRSIDEHAERAGNVQTFYWQVLQRLVDEELIDLEAIETASQTERQQGPLSPYAALDGGMQRDETSRSDCERATRGDELYAQLAHHLGGAAAPGSQGSQALLRVIEELARDHPEQLQRILLELREGVLETPQTLRLSGTELRALVRAFLSLPSASEWTERTQLGRSIDEHAERAGNTQVFYGQVLQRLVHGELIDLEAIETASQAERQQGALSPDAALAGGMQRDETSRSDCERATRGDELYAQLAHHLGGVAAPGLQGSQALLRVIEELARDHPDRLHRIFRELREGVLEKSRAMRLSGAELRALVQAFLFLSPVSGQTGLTQLGRSIDEHASNAQAFYGQIFQRLMDGKLIDLEAIDAASRIGERQVATASEGEQANPISTVDANRRDSDRTTRGYDLYSRLAHHLGGATARGALGSLALTQVIEELARDHPDQLHRIFLELRKGALEKSRALRLSGTELRALVHAFLSLPPASAQTERRQLGRSIDEHAERAGDAQVFYGQVLQRLVGGELVDLEAIEVVSRIGSHPGTSPLGAEQAVGKAERRGAPQQDMHAAKAAEETGEADRALAAYLREGVRVPDTARQKLMDCAEGLLGQAPEKARRLLRESLVDEAAVTRLVELLPERLLARALYALAPAVHARVQRYVDVVANAFQGLVAGLGNARITTLKWQFCFRYLLSVADRVDLRELVHGLVDYLASHARPVSTDELRGRVRDRLVATASQFPDSVGRQAAQILAFEDSEELPVAPELPPDHSLVPDIKRDLEVLEEGIRLANAGQVIASPYLPRLFGMLDLVEEGSFKSPEARERAVHLLQFMVNEADDSAEYDLVLNKVLCGLDTAMPICRRISVTGDEKAKIEGLLSAMIQHWEALGNTSVGGLRESFLQREGALRLKRNGWHLSVEPKAFDMLLDRMPWTFSTIKHPWMKEVLHVTWR